MRWLSFGVLTQTILTAKAILHVNSVRNLYLYLYTYLTTVETTIYLPMRIIGFAFEYLNSQIRMYWSWLCRDSSIVAVTVIVAVTAKSAAMGGHYYSQPHCLVFTRTKSASLCKHCLRISTALSDQKTNRHFLHSTLEELHSSSKNQL